MPDRSRRNDRRDRRSTPEHIEVVTPDDPTWWDGALASNPFPTAPPPTTTTPGRRRRLVIVGSVAAVALIAVAAVAAVSNDDTKPEPAPEVAAGHFVIDGPGLRPYSADIVTPLPINARYTLYASGNPTNPWISLQTYRTRGDTRPAVDSSRREVAGRNLTTPRNERSMTNITASIGDGWTADVRAFNIDDQQLVQFVDELKVSDVATGAVQLNEGILAANSLMSTRTARWAEELLFGTVTTEMRALTSDGTAITLRESPADVDTRPATLAYFTTGLFGGSNGYTAATLVPSGESIVTWAAGGKLLSLTGQVSTSRLLEISQMVRVADDSEWRTLVFGLHPDYRLGEFAEAGSGVAADGSPWRSGVQLAERGGVTEYLWWWTVPGTPGSDSTPTASDLAAGPGNETIVVGSTTYVFVWVPADSRATFASVRAADGSATTVQLRLLFADVPVRVAAMRIDVPGAVEISTA